MAGEPKTARQPAATPDAAVASGVKVMEAAAAEAQGDTVQVLSKRAVPGVDGPDPAVLSDDERAIVTYLVQHERHKNFYRYSGEQPPYYRGWNYLTNVVWYLRTVYAKDGHKLTDDELLALEQALGAPRNARVPADKSQAEIPPVGPKGWPREWSAIYFGGVIPLVQEVLAELRAPFFADIEQQGQLYTSQSTARSFHAQDHGDKAKDALADSRRLELLAKGKGYLGTEYAQSHPENSAEGKALHRRPTLDCAGFIDAVYQEVKVLTSPSGAVLSLGSTVSSQYWTAVRYPDTLRIVMGPRCKRVASAAPGSSGPLLIEDKIDNVPFDGTIRAGDLGLTGMKISPHKEGNTPTSDFRHIVMFTGKKVSSNVYECLHASDFGECVDVGAKSITEVGVIIRPVL